MTKRMNNRDRVFALLAALGFALTTACLATGYVGAKEGGVDEPRRNLAAGFGCLFLFNTALAKRGGRG